jgi:hypothetical protein
LITFEVEKLINIFSSDFLLGKSSGSQEGQTPLAYWGVFSVDLSEREENTLISYGVL